jgi:hypothetical protein
MHHYLSTSLFHPRDNIIEQTMEQLQLPVVYAKRDPDSSPRPTTCVQYVCVGQQSITIPRLPFTALTDIRYLQSHFHTLRPEVDGCGTPGRIQGGIYTIYYMQYLPPPIYTQWLDRNTPATHVRSAISYYLHNSSAGLAVNVAKSAQYGVCLHFRRRRRVSARYLQVSFHLRYLTALSECGLYCS